MDKYTKAVLTIIALSTVSGCAGLGNRIAEYKACENEAYSAIPKKLVTVQASETVMVRKPTGAYDCSGSVSGRVYGSGTISGTTNQRCEPETRLVAEERFYDKVVDSNSQRRSAYQSSCADKRCISKYGNKSCKEN